MIDFVRNPSKRFVPQPDNPYKLAHEALRRAAVDYTGNLILKIQHDDPKMRQAAVSILCAAHWLNTDDFPETREDMQQIVDAFRGFVENKHQPGDTLTELKMKVEKQTLLQGLEQFHKDSLDALSKTQKHLSALDVSKKGAVLLFHETEGESLLIGNVLKDWTAALGVEKNHPVFRKGKEFPSDDEPGSYSCALISYEGMEAILNNERGKSKISNLGRF